MTGRSKLPIASQPELNSRWVFKGGTCLRKCFHETYRFSEDLDFTVVDGGPETAEELLPVMERVGGWLRQRTGIGRGARRADGQAADPAPLQRRGCRPPTCARR